MKKLLQIGQKGRIQKYTLDASRYQEYEITYIPEIGRAHV